jgi:hypothetical protein
MKIKFKYIGVAASLVIFVNGVYFDSKVALVLGSILAALAILDREISGYD